MTAHDSSLKYSVGDQVVKVGGRYGGPGRIVGMTEDLDENGYRLYNVAIKVAGGYGEFIHVFPAACLRPADKASVSSNPYENLPSVADRDWNRLSIDEPRERDV